jgi:16S rRNA G966 N2-methylase RsmD
MCLLVSYPELFDLLNRSKLLHAGSILFVEYPKQLTSEIPDTVAGLVQVRNRKYGRTHIVVYGAPDLTEEDDDDDGF